MMNKIAVFLYLLGSTAAAIDRSCVDIKFDDKTNILSGRCLPYDNSGYLPTALDLNNCFGYDGKELTPDKRNFSDSCNNCRMFVAPDPWWGGKIYWLGCTCDGSAEEVTVPIEAAVAHEYVHNEGGVLRC
ncbi:hypothetical protein NW768_011252 [Fusarium equiseti]|uniref:Cyanovirin-N domain-containing protein n=1 Tax=Fusarium equiseti TaxID=61235 RepID=A0ABQ8QY83_FUSEQ|nr:hypothetical protein NW768_011252 [Fusarium equiseti]